MAPHKRVLQLYSADRPEIHEVVEEMRNVLEEYGNDRLMIGEIYLPLARLVSYYGRDLRGAHLPFNFHLIEAPWHARNLDREIDEYEAALPAGGWPNWVLSNHDKSRIAARVGPRQARVAAMLLLTLRGTPTIYYGDELGMQDVEIPPQCVRDPFELNVPGKGFGRDPQRTPMQWSGASNAGFTTGSPWLPLAPDAATVNVAAEADDERSMLWLYRRLLALRRERAALSAGGYVPLQATGDVLAYARVGAGERFVIVLNLGAEPAEASLPCRCRILLSTHGDRDGESLDAPLRLRADEGILALEE